MSIQPGETLEKDPDAILVYEFDWTDWLGDTAQIVTSTFAISGGDTAAPPGTVLTKDNAVIVSGGKKTQIRLLNGTKGKKYEITNHIVTNEVPAQEDDRSFFVKMVEQ